MPVLSAAAGGDEGRSMVEGAHVRAGSNAGPPPPHFVRSPSPFRGGAWRPPLPRLMPRGALRLQETLDRELRQEERGEPLHRGPPQ